MRNRDGRFGIPHSAFRIPHLDAAWSAPLAAFGIGRRVRSGAFASWVLQSVSLAGAVALAAEAFWEGGAGRSARGLPRGLALAHPDQLFLGSIALSALPILTLVAT